MQQHPKVKLSTPKKSGSKDQSPTPNPILKFIQKFNTTQPVNQHPPKPPPTTTYHNQPVANETNQQLYLVVIVHKVSFEDVDSIVRGIAHDVIRSIIQNSGTNDRKVIFTPCREKI